MIYKKRKKRKFAERAKKVLVTACYVSDHILCSKWPTVAGTQAYSRLRKSFTPLAIGLLWQGSSGRL